MLCSTQEKPQRFGGGGGGGVGWGGGGGVGRPKPILVSLGPGMGYLGANTGGGPTGQCPGTC